MYVSCVNVRVYNLCEGKNFVFDRALVCFIADSQEKDIKVSTPPRSWWEIRYTIKILFSLTILRT